MKFGNKLKKLREEKRLTQAELAEIFSISEATVHFYENNKRPPTYYLLNEIAKYFNVTPEYLLGYDDLDRIVFANRLKDLREELFLTQPDLGGVINISQSNVSRYEKGLSFPSVETLYLIADYFDTSIDYLVGRTDRRKLVFTEDDKLQEVGKQYFEIDKEFKKLGLTPKRILEIIKALDSVGLINKK